jgi:hypothetical protein
MHGVHQSRTPELLTAFVARIGSCPRCVRQAFVAAVIAWCGCLPAAIMTSRFNAPLLVVASLTIAALLTALWVTHLVVFGLRAALRATAPATGTAGAWYSGAERDSARRSFLGVMAKAAGGLAIASLVPAAAYAASKTLKIVVKRGTPKFKELLARGSITDNNPEHKIWCCLETCCDDSCNTICDLHCYWCGS